MTQVLATGNEAVAWGSLAAGVDYFSHYPGSPVNSIDPFLKKIAKDNDYFLHVNNALNEHVATLAAAGASFMGAKSLVVMKHVGVNIAADPLNYLGYTGVKGGMVVVVGTDPGANCSTGECDVHWYVSQTNFPLFEPTTVKDIYKYTIEAFKISKEYQVPCFIFLPTRICNNSAILEVDTFSRKTEAETEFRFEKDVAKYVNVGNRAVINHKKLIDRVNELSTKNIFYKSMFNEAADLALLTRGVAFNHAVESIVTLGLEKEVHLINCDMVFPLGKEQLLTLIKNKTKIVVVEDQDGFLEYVVKMKLFNDIKCEVVGKEIFSETGEISIDQVNKFLCDEFGKVYQQGIYRDIEDLPERLGTFCEGCPHRSSFYAIDSVLSELKAEKDIIIGGDIGCSSLPPQRADWLLCMNAGIGISQGMAPFTGEQILVSTGGDGSFFHGGIIHLQSAVENSLDLLHIVFDNRTVAMTGHQESPSNNEKFNYRKLLEAINVGKIMETDAFNPNDFKYKLKTLLGETGVRVLWVKGECALLAEKEKDTYDKEMVINSSRCGECDECYTALACPAILQNESMFLIDELKCKRCGVCREICEHEAVEIRWYDER